MTSNPVAPIIGFAADEIDISAPTRSARLKWVVIVNEALPPGRAVNAAVCAAVATTSQVGGMLGPDGLDAAGSVHPGLPWAGCSVLTADGSTLQSIRQKAEAHPETFVADMPQAAQETRVYAVYLDALQTGDPLDLDYLAVSLIGPKNRVDKLVGRLPLMA